MEELPMISYINGETEVVMYDEENPTISSPNAEYDLQFKQTRASFEDPELYRAFIKNVESRFRRCKEYKIFKAGLMARGYDHCQMMGNIESSDMVDIELHHNVLSLFDICVLISQHIINTIGYITTFDLIQLLIIEHFNERVGVTFLSTTPHQVFTSDPEGFIPPDMTIGRWWELLDRYPYGITFEIANKIKKYIYKFQNELPVSIDVRHQEQILDFAYYNQFGMKIGDLSGYQQVQEGDNYDFV